VIAKRTGKRRKGLRFHERRRQMWSKSRQLHQPVLARESLVRKNSP
jgi:hypothetical protein